MASHACKIRIRAHQSECIAFAWYQTSQNVSGPYRFVIIIRPIMATITTIFNDIAICGGCGEVPTHPHRCRIQYLHTNIGGKCVIVDIRIGRIENRQPNGALYNTVRIGYGTHIDAAVHQIGAIDLKPCLTIAAHRTMVFGHFIRYYDAVRLHFAPYSLGTVYIPKTAAQYHRLAHLYGCVGCARCNLRHNMITIIEIGCIGHMQ